MSIGARQWGTGFARCNGKGNLMERRRNLQKRTKRNSIRMDGLQWQNRRQRAVPQRASDTKMVS